MPRLFCPLVLLGALFLSCSQRVLLMEERVTSSDIGIVGLGFFTEEARGDVENIYTGETRKDASWKFVPDHALNFEYLMLDESGAGTDFVPYEPANPFTLAGLAHSESFFINNTGLLVFAAVGGKTYVLHRARYTAGSIRGEFTLRPDRVARQLPLRPQRGQILFAGNYRLRMEKSGQLSLGPAYETLAQNSAQNTRYFGRAGDDPATAEKYFLRKFIENQPEGKWKQIACDRLAALPE